MADYYIDEYGNVTKNKKKKKADYVVDENGMFTAIPKEKVKKGGNDGSWFKSGVFSDGYDFGDVTKTILGTGTDLIEELAEGVMEIPEAVIDAGAYLVGGTGKLFGADGFANKTKKFIAKDLYDSEAILKESNKHSVANHILGWMGTDTEEASVLGDKSEGLLNSAGQLIATFALGAAHVPWFVTSGVTSFGGEVENAFQQGASYEEAGISAAITAGAEILTEKLFGGSGLGEKGWINTEVFTKGISRKGLKVLADFGIDVLSEGGEEVASQFFSTLGQQLTYEKEETWAEILSDEEKAEKYLWQVVNSLFGKEAWKGYGDAFIGGMVLSGGMNTGKAVYSAKSGRDYRTGLTADEEAVVSKETENRIAEAEKSGKKLTNKDKAIIRDQALKALGKGDISIDVIEEVLGGDTYKSYQDTVKNEDAAIKPILDEAKSVNDEFKALNQMKKGDMTGEQTDRLEELRARKAELQEQIKNTKKTSERDFLQKKYKNEAYELAKGSKLEESYNERARKGQKYQADASQYKGIAKESIQSIIDKGQINNTNKAHELIDFAVSSAAARGKKVTTTTTAEILAKAEQKHGKDYVRDNFFKQVTDEKGNKKWVLSKIPNAEIDGDTIALNVNSPNLTQAVIGHEIGHTFEGTKYYGELAELLNSYDKSVKGEEAYTARKNATDTKYQSIAGANSQYELNADLLGEYIFSDEGFVRHLAQNEKVFTGILGRIKYMLKYATSGSQQERDLLRIKRTFEKAWRDGVKGTNRDTVQYALSKDINGDVFVDVTEDIFDSSNGESVARTIQRIISERFKNLIDVHGQKIQINKTTNDEFRHSESVNHLLKNPLQTYNDKLKTIANADEILLAAKNWIGEEIKHTRKDDIVEFARGNVTYRVGGNGYVADVIVGIRKNGAAILYDLVNIYDKKITEAPVTMASNNNSQRRQDASAEDIIPQNSKKSTGNANESFSNAEVTRYSLTKDIDNFDNSLYNEIELPAAEKERVQSEALTWHAGKRNQLITQTLSNETTYRYVIDDDGIVHIYEKEQSVNIHDWGENYGNTNTTQLDSITEELWAGQRDNSSDSSFSQDRREPRKDDTNDNNFVSGEGRSNGTGYSKDRTNAYGKPKKRHWHFNEDGSTEVTYSDGTKEILDTAPSEKASSEDGVFFDGKSHFSLANAVDAPVGQGTPLKDLRVNALPDDYAPIAETPSSQTSVDSETVAEELLDIDDLWAYNVDEPIYNTKDSFAEEIFSKDSRVPDADDIKKAVYEYGINEDETTALRTYVSGGAYDLTRTQRSNDRSEQSEYEAYIEEQVRAGLLKHPTYSGLTYRNLDFDTVFNSDEDYNIFLKEHAIGKVVDLEAFTSASKEPNGYSSTGNKAVHLVINGQSARDISRTFNGSQQEVIYLPGTRYRVVRITTANDGNPLIYGKEIVSNEVQELQGNATSTESLNSAEGISERQEHDSTGLLRDGRVQENMGRISKGSAQEQLRNAIQIQGDRRSDAQAERNEIAPFEKASSEDGVFFDGENIADDLGPIAQDPVVQEPTEAESDAKTENSNLSVRELYEQKLSNHKNALDALEHDKSNSLSSFDEAIRKKLEEYNGLKNKNTKRANTLLQQTENLRLRRDNVQADYASRIAKQQARIEAFESKSFEEFENEVLTARRKDLNNQRIELVKSTFEENGRNFDEDLANAKSLSTFKTVENTPQRVNDKTFGWEAGHILSDITVNKVAQHTTEGIKWLNTITDKKNGLIAQLVNDYGIKPGSKAAEAAQMYAEGFWVDKNDNIWSYGDEELAKDFPDSKVRENIKKLAKDQRIRQFYNETLEAINESRRRNGYPEIQKLDNYFLHFREQSDFFSRNGLPFNPNDMKSKNLPTDVLGTTIDRRPGQPFFASGMHRQGKRTSFDILRGIEMYANSALPQIYYIDDIQMCRALRNYIVESYGQAKGLENLDALSEEETQAKIKQVFNGHLATYANFLNEEANILAGKTALVDRALGEGAFGRGAIKFMSALNSQVGSNQVGYNASSPLTNLIAVVQGFAKTNKADFIKGFAQLVSNKVNSIHGKSDGFTEASPVVIRRKGAERYYRNTWQKLSDPGYALMGAVDNFSTELIARAKYNELTRKGMDSETAHVETDKWVSRLMGDRSLGQLPLLYNSKMLGLITKYQLEVRNQLDSQFYDTIKEANASTEDIQNGLERNAKKAAKITATFVELAVGQHLFGKAFEAVAGYNPAFDIISVLIKALGFDDEDSEDTVLDNLGQGLYELAGDMPYSSFFLDGGRIPMSNAIPDVGQILQGEDDYGNQIGFGQSLVENIAEVAPYYFMPGGYGQLKKTTQGLSMFDDDLPVSGSYTDSGKLRFPVDKNLWKVVQAGLFGQYASENARDYFDNERTALNEKQIQEFVDSGISIQDYWKYREGLSGLKTLAEKADYIYGLDIPIEAKNLFINNLSGRKEEIDLSGMEGFESFEEYDYAQSNPGKYAVSKAVASGLEEYKKYSSELGAIESDKDKNGKTVSGSRKEKVVKYINDLDLDYGQKIILYRSQYKSDNTYNYEIVDYLNGRDDISYETMVAILKELGFTVKGNTVTWD